jgi:hippurate hydrolase
MKRPLILFAAFFLAFLVPAYGADDLVTEINSAYLPSEQLYLDLHTHPELSGQETQTAATLASGLRTLGFKVTTGVGRTGVVGVLTNGPGPTVLLRTELDALPVEEKTNLPYASKVHAKDANGLDTSVMHACGHDVHMAAWMGTARIMAGARGRWSGTLVLIAQPAEETLSGAGWMLADGLLSRFPRPDFALAVHDDTRLPAGLVGYHAGPILSNSDTLKVTIYGAGGHGGWPETTIDPVVIAARTVVTLQTIVAREISPLDAAVVTVGYMHAGTKANVIPAEARIDLSVRSLTPEVRARLLKSIDRIVKAEALAGGATREPTIERIDGANAMVNDADLTRRLAGVLERELGKERVVDLPPAMASEDFSRFRENGIPSVMLMIGAVEPDKFAAAKASGTQLPSLHSPFFAPDRERTIKTAIATEVIALRELMPPKS